MDMFSVPARPYQCMVCCRSYNSKLYLRDHMTIHTDVRSYECKICCRRFRFASNLSEHKTVHIPNNLFFKCTECSHAVRLRGNLKKHMRKHFRDNLSLDEAWRKFCMTHPSMAAMMPQQMNVLLPQSELGVSFNFRPSSIMRNCVDDLINAFVKKVNECASLADSVDGFLVALEDLDIDLIDCPFCGKRFASFFECKTHIFTAPTKHEKPVDEQGHSLFCEICLRCFESAVALEKHAGYHSMVSEMTITGYLDIFSNHRGFAEVERYRLAHVAEN